MKLQDICTSLEPSQELEKAGYPQESLFYWLDFGSQGKFKLVSKKEKDQALIMRVVSIYYAAPTVSELGEELPDEINSLFLKIIKMDKERWEVYYQDYAKENIIVCGSAKSFANAMAKMWLYLKKEGLLDD